MLEKEIKEIGSRPIVIVMGRNYTTRLTLTRSAGMVGCDVILIQTDKKRNRYQKIDKKSKFVSRCHYCPEPNKELLLQTILLYSNVNQKKILLPADDYVASVVDENLNQLKENFLLPHVNFSQGMVLNLMEKDYQKKLAEKVGMNVARAWVCYYKNGKYAIPEDIRFPCFTKPQESYSAALKHFLKKCDNKEQLEALLNKVAKTYQLPFLIEEYINITKEYGVQGVSLNDKSIIPTIVYKDSNRRGLTATGRIFPISSIPGLQEKLSDFMRETHFTGIFDIDLFESKGQFYFNELNVRLGANGFALTYGIYNVPGIFIKNLLDQSDGGYNGPIEFKEKSFASEKVIRDMYYDGTLSFEQYKRTQKEADILSLMFDSDNGPYHEFSKLDRILPLWRQLRKWKKQFN